MRLPPVLALGAHRHRHQRAHLDALGGPPAGDQERAQRAGDDREHDVVDGAAEGVLDGLEVLELAGHPDEAPVRPDRHVQRRFRGRVQAGPDDLADALGRLAGARQRALGVRERVERALRQRRARAQRAPSRPAASRCAVPGSGCGCHGRPGVRDRRRVGREVEQHRRQIDAGDAVDQRVVGLGDQREAVVLQALDQPHLPQRLGAVELLGEDPRGQVLQLLPAARARAARCGGRGTRG